MQEVNKQIGNVKPIKNEIRLLPILIIWGLVFFAFSVFVIVTSDELNPIKDYYLIPWVFLAALVILAPSIFLLYKDQFNLFHPLVFAAWSYFFPAFVIGGFILAAGWSEPYFLSFIQDPTYNLPLTMIVVILGYAGLTLGFFLPVGRIIGEQMRKFLPKLQWKTESLLFPGFVLLIIGLFNTIMGYVFGILGYQRLDEIGTFDGILFLLTLFWLQSSFLLWLVLIKRRKLDLFAVLIGSVLLLTALLKALYAGNRGGLFQIFIMITMAYFMAGNRMKFKQSVLAGCVLLLSIVVGMIYGTTFRNVKQTQSLVGIEEYTGFIFDTFGEISKKDNLNTLEQGFTSLAERLDTVSSLAVVVSNYEHLRPYEEGYGLDNNIWNDIATFFIPRVIWHDKPLASEPAAYSELYFAYRENSFAITPMGDLIRNFDLIGVPLGMILLGAILRVLYVSLVEGEGFFVWRLTVYYMLLTAVSYEGFYGTIIPYLFKVGLTALVGIVIIHLFTPHSKINRI